MQSLSTTHEQLLRVLDDDLTAISTEDGVVVLNLRPLVVQLGDRVAIFGRVAERLPADTGRVEIMEAEQLGLAQDVTHLLRHPRTLPLDRAVRRSPHSRSGSPGIGADRSCESSRSARSSPATLVLVVRGRRRQLRGRQSRPGRFGAAGRERRLGDSHRAPARRGPDARRARDRAPGRRVARRSLDAGDRGSASPRAVARASGDRLRRRCSSLLALLVWWGPTAQMRRWQLVLVFAVLLGLGVAALTRAARADREPEAQLTA